MTAVLRSTPLNMSTAVDQCKSYVPPPVSYFSNSSQPHTTRSSPSSTQSCGINNAAKAAVVEMGFPDELVQLAIDVHLLDHGANFSEVTELFLAVEDLSNNPGKQAECIKRLYNHAQKQVRQIPPLLPKPLDSPPKADCSLDCSKIDLLPIVAAPKDEPLKSSASVASVRLSAEMSKDEVPMVAGEKSEIRKRVQLLARENQRLKERKMCRACHKVELATSGITFLPCGHFVTCETCSEMFDDCPACGKNIMGTVRTFLS